MNELESTSGDFVAHLRTLLARARHSGPARASLARLRRGFSDDPRCDPRVFEAVGDALPSQVRDWELDAYLITASLFALYAQGRDVLPKGALPGRHRSLGASARHLRDQLERKGKAGGASLDRRFTSLLETRAEDLTIHIRRLMQLLASHDVPVDFASLLKDLIGWQDRQRYVARRWAEDYWQPAHAS